MSTANIQSFVSTYICSLIHDKNFLPYKEQVEFTEHLCAKRQDAINDGKREEQRELRENELEIRVFSLCL